MRPVGLSAQRGMRVFKKRIKFKLEKFVGPSGSSPWLERRNQRVTLSADDGLLASLTALTTRWPPPGGRKHYLVLGDSGLQLGLWQPDMLRRISVTSDDLINPDRLIAEIEYLTKFQMPADDDNTDAEG